MALNFPAKIYQILENESSDIIHWHGNGIAFRIVDHGRFEREIIPKYFRHNQLSSVQRQLNLYGFKCINRGDDKGAFYHPKFKRGDWEVVKKITRFAPNKKCGDDAAPATTEKKSEGDSPNSDNCLKIIVTPTQPVESVNFQHQQQFVNDTFQDSFAQQKPASAQFGQLDPFTFVESNNFHSVSNSVSDFSSNWQGWQNNNMFNATGFAPLKQEVVGYPSFSDFGFQFNLEPILPIKEENSAPQAATTKRSTFKRESSSENKYVFAVNDVVTVDPDFDLDADFALFNDIGQTSDFYPSIMVDRDTMKSKPSTQDVGVNTDVSQNGNFFELFNMYRPM